MRTQTIITRHPFKALSNYKMYAVAFSAETSRLKNEISLKYGLHIKKKSQNLVKMAEDFISPAKASNDYGLPDRIIKELTHQEMKDLKQIFDLFDVAGTG